MSTNVQKFDEGSKILKNIDVSSIVSGLALGIAEAQERLDNNSISQLIRLADTKVAGKSLLEFGFQPAFYAFDYADVSASIQLKMAVQESVSVDFSIEASYSSNTTFNKDFFNQLRKNKSKSTSKYSKTQKTIALEAKTSKNVSVNEESFKIHEEEGSISKIESAEEKMRDDSEELRVESVIDNKQELTNETNSDVYIREENGYIVITNPIEHTNVTALLKLDPDYTTAKDIRIKGGSTVNASSLFSKTGDFNTTLTNATTANNGNSPTTPGEVVGINKNGIRRGTTDTPYAFYFGWDKHKVNYDYAYNQSNPSLTTDDIELLAFVLKESTLKITIKGYTDGSGSDSQANSDYNKALGLKRATALKEALEGFAGKKLDSQITTETYGEDLATNSDKLPEIRKVTIEFDATTLFDFIYFQGGHITTGATTSAPEEYVYLLATNPTVDKDVIFQFGSTTYTLVDIANTINRFSALTNNKGKIDEFFVEKHNESYYLLHEEAKVNYFLHSKENKEINVEIENKASAELDKDKTDIYVSDTQNDTSKLKESSKDFEGDRAFAVSGSLDVRYARQFGMSIEGNASVSARMVSVPPPTALENYIQSLSNSGN